MTLSPVATRQRTDRVGVLNPPPGHHRATIFLFSPPDHRLPLFVLVPPARRRGAAEGQRGGVSLPGGQLDNQVPPYPGEVYPDRGHLDCQ